MAIYQCEMCGQSFKRSPSQNNRNKSGRLFCSRKCAARRQQRTLPPLTCPQCGKTFYRKPSEYHQNNYCSRTCANQARSRTLQDAPSLRDTEGVAKNCVQCGEVFYVKPYRHKKAKYCSAACFHAHRYGRPGKGNGKNMAGNQNPNFKGTSNLVTARDNARARFGNACMICSWDIAVAVHHITPRRHGGTNNLDNLIVLCPNHHAMADRGLLTPDELRQVTHAALAQLSDRLPLFDPLQSHQPETALPLDESSPSEEAS